MSSKISNPASICILRFSSIGDVCHAVSCVQALQARWPGAKITWVIGKVEAQLLAGLDGVEFIIFDKKQGLKGYLQLKSSLKGRHFDVLLHMQTSLRASLAAFCISATEKWGFDSQRARELQWLFSNRRIAAQTSPHVADGFMAFARAIGVSEDYQPDWQMPINEADEAWHKKYLSGIGPYVAISPAASEPERNWLTDSYAVFANYLNRQGYRVVLCGGKSAFETKLAASIERQCDFHPVNLVGKTSLKQMLVVLKYAQCLVAPDTGPVHMAVSVNTPVVGLYMHSNPLRTGPYKYQQYVVSHYGQALETATGKSIEENSWGKRLKGDDLMGQIKVDEVIASFNRLAEDFQITLTKDSQDKISSKLPLIEKVG